MPLQQHDPAYQTVWLIRRLFRSMASLADRYLHDSGLSAADRAVMEFLYPEAELTVPDIARRYAVSRQHVQITVNALLTKGLLESGENPRHKRSLLIRLSSLGRNCFAEIRRNESALVEQLFADIPADSIGATNATLEALLNKLN